MKVANNIKILAIPLLLFLISLAVVYSAERPAQDGDENSWGTKLNNHLAISLDSEGFLHKGLNASILDLNVTGTLITQTVNSTFMNVSQQLVALGNVGIGTSSPNQKLVVIGTANITQGLNVTGGIRVSGLASCTSDIETDSEGNFFCGSSDTDTTGDLNLTDSDGTEITITDSEELSIIGDGNITTTASGNELTINWNVTSTLSYFLTLFQGIEGIWTKTNTSDYLRDNSYLDKDNITFWQNEVGNVTLVSQLDNDANYLDKDTDSYDTSSTDDYGLSNFTSDYDLRTDRFDNENLTQGNSINITGSTISVNMSRLDDLLVDLGYNKSISIVAALTTTYPNLDTDSTDDYATSNFLTDYENQAYYTDTNASDLPFSNFNKGNITVNATSVNLTNLKIHDGSNDAVLEVEAEGNSGSAILKLAEGTGGTSGFAFDFDASFNLLYIRGSDSDPTSGTQHITVRRTEGDTCIGCSNPLVGNRLTVADGKLNVSNGNITQSDGAGTTYLKYIDSTGAYIISKE
jgi:hypothetical protein